MVKLSLDLCYMVTQNMICTQEFTISWMNFAGADMVEAGLETALGGTEWFIETAVILQQQKNYL